MGDTLPKHPQIQTIISIHLPPETILHHIYIYPILCDITTFFNTKILKIEDKNFYNAEWMRVYIA